MGILLSICLMFGQHYNLSNYQKRNVCKYEKLIKKEANKNNVDPKLLAAVIYVESSFRTSVLSSAGACGLTQVIPKWTGGPETGGIKYTCEQLKNPITSIKVGAKILGYVTKHYADGNIEKGLCFYNAGTKCITRKRFYERLYYVKKVMQVYSTISVGC